MIRSWTSAKAAPSSDPSSVPLVLLGTFFPRKLARPGMGAKVGSYLAVLIAANARGMRRRRARLDGAAQLVLERSAARTSRQQQYLQRWEDDGGRVRRAP